MFVTLNAPTVYLKDIRKILGILGVLVIAGYLLLLSFKSYDDKEESYKNIPYLMSIIISGILGFISGLVGIGGGVFLSPILFLLKVARPKHIVTAASLFILINSIFGVMGQLTKNSVLNETQDYFYLLIAVLIGGSIGQLFKFKNIYQ